MGHWEVPSTSTYTNLDSLTGGDIMPNSTAGLSSANSSDACISIVHNLMCHRQGGESESFAKKAIECLVKKLKDKPDELDGLIQAVTLNGSNPTKCATIPRTLDGRLQVAGKKVFPHVIYARIWRWSDIQKSELKQINYCQFAFDLKLDSVCVNPYHYERVISPGLDLSLHGINLQHGCGGEEGMYNNEYENINSPQSMMNGQARMYGGMGMGDLASMLANNPSSSSTENRKPSCTVVHGSPMMQPAPPSGIMFDPFNAAMPPSGESLTNLNLYHHPNNNNNNNMAGGMQMIQSSANYWTPGPPSRLAPSMMLPELSDPMALFNQQNQRMYEQGRYEDALRKQAPPDYWCSISYFELDQQVGETFKVRNAYKSIVVDGYANPGHSDRFCLGPLTNVHRTEASEKARLHIGKGIRLEYHDDLSVSLGFDGESEAYSVFVQSGYLDLINDKALGDAVHKIPPNTVLKIFDLKLCYNQMIQQLDQAQALQCAQAAVVTGRSQTNSLSPVPPMTLGSSVGIGADDLRRLSVLRLSFVKGWGGDYNRKTIKETPCWIEIQINRALQLLDEVLRSAPSNEPRNMTEYP